MPQADDRIPLAQAFVDEHGHLRQPGVRAQGREIELAERGEAGVTGSAGGFQFHGFSGFKWRSVIGAVVASQLLMYVVSCWLMTPRGALQPSNAALWKLGSSNSLAEMCAARYDFPRHLIELRRWFVPIFLHASPMHILLNLFFECSSGPAIEERDSPLAFAMLFLGAGVLGNLLSDTFGVNGVGGSTSCYGIIGMNMASWYEQWGDLSQEQREMAKQSIMQSCGMLALWEIINWKTIDHFGHLGGFIGGFLILLGRSDRRHYAVFAVLVVISVYVICVHPNSREVEKCRFIDQAYSTQQSH